jgi:hypothetical protein
MSGEVTTKLRVGIIGVANIAKKNALAIQNSVSDCVISAVGKLSPCKALDLNKVLTTHTKLDTVPFAKPREMSTKLPNL